MFTGILPIINTRHILELTKKTVTLKRSVFRWKWQRVNLEYSVFRGKWWRVIQISIESPILQYTKHGNLNNSVNYAWYHLSTTYLKWTYAKSNLYKTLYHIRPLSVQWNWGWLKPSKELNSTLFVRSRISRMTMFELRFYAIIIFALIVSVRGGKSCPVKCDMVQELSLTRQLLNQESMLRVSMNQELLELKKAFAELQRDTRQMNVSLEATQRDEELLELKKAFAELRRDTRQMNASLEATQRDASQIASLQSSVTSARQDITAAERAIIDFNQTIQGKNLCDCKLASTTFISS